MDQTIFEEPVLLQSNPPKVSSKQMNKLLEAMEKLWELETGNLIETPPWILKTNIYTLSKTYYSSLGKAR